MINIMNGNLAFDHLVSTDMWQSRFILDFAQTLQ